MRVSSISSLFVIPFLLAVARPLEDKRQLDIVSDIVGITKDVVDLGFEIWDKIDDINQAQHTAEQQFTQGVVNKLRIKHPEKNVIVYHNQKSDASGLVNAAHQHYELDLPQSLGTKGYEIFVFDSGHFHRAGDGGFENWAYDGAFSTSDMVSTADVDFTLPEATTGDVSPPAAPADIPLAPQQPTRVVSSNTDGNYFVNCQNRVDGTISSGMAYYKYLNPGQNVGQRPDDYIDVTHGSFVTWEQVGKVTFSSTGVTVHWSVFGNAGEASENTAVGTADNVYENFWVYKANGGFLYSVDSWDCNAIYWAF